MTDTEPMQGRPHEDYEIHTHGNLELFVKAVARKFGWEASVENRDIDPLETQERGYTYRVPGRGDVVLTRKDAATAFEYHLPEYAMHLFADIQSAIKGHEMDRDRRMNPSAAKRPLVVGRV